MNRQNAIQASPGNSVPAAVTPVAPASSQAPETRSEWSYVPAIDAYELPEAYVIEFDAPGLKPAAIDLSYDAGVLRLHGCIEPRTPQSASYLRQEYGVGDFDREVPLGRLAEFVDGGRAAAEYAHGVLTITLPKLEAAQPKRIAIRSASA